jgi:ssDNA thymidine ADP-ribosyltransferase, DarT
VTPVAPVRIFHITPICNLASIADRGALYAKSVLSAKGMEYGNIAFQEAQGKRATKLVAKPPGGTIHHYVPFYFAPRSPMLRTIEGGNVKDCPHRQKDIVHFESTVEAVTSKGLPYVFYDYNATLDIATCYSDVKHLDKINWPLFFEPPRLDGYCQFWFSTMTKPKYALRQETRQAEFLVHREFPLKLMTRVGVCDDEKRAEVSRLFEQSGIKLPTEVKSDWYF